MDQVVERCGMAWLIMPGKSSQSTGRHIAFARTCTLMLHHAVSSFDLLVALMHLVVANGAPATWVVQMPGEHPACVDVAGKIQMGANLCSYWSCSKYLCCDVYDHMKPTWCCY